MRHALDIATKDLRVWMRDPSAMGILLGMPALLIVILGGSRLGYRVWKERRLRNVLDSPGKPVVILGAGDAAADLLKNLARAGDWLVGGASDGQNQLLREILDRLRKNQNAFGARTGADWLQADKNTANPYDASMTTCGSVTETIQASGEK